MNNSHLKFNRRSFSTYNEMCDILLTESNEHLLKIDLGELENCLEERNEIRWRLMHLQRVFEGNTPVEYRSTYNSLWSQLYRLDHQDEHKSPIIKELLRTMMKEE